MLTTGAEARGLAGLVIDGGCADRAALEAHGFPVFSTTVALRGATKQRGHRRVPGRGGRGRGGHRGDWVVGDADGVGGHPGRQLVRWSAAGRERAEKEEGFFPALKGGWTTVQLLDLDSRRSPRAYRAGRPTAEA